MAGISNTSLAIPSTTRLMTMRLLSFAANYGPISFSTGLLPICSGWTQKPNSIQWRNSHRLDLARDRQEQCLRVPWTEADSRGRLSPICKVLVMHCTPDFRPAQSVLFMNKNLSLIWHSTTEAAPVCHIKNCLFSTGMLRLG